MRQSIETADGATPRPWGTFSSDSCLLRQSDTARHDGIGHLGVMPDYVRVGINSTTAPLGSTRQREDRVTNARDHELPGLRSVPESLRARPGRSLPSACSAWRSVWRSWASLNRLGSSRRADLVRRLAHAPGSWRLALGRAVSQGQRDQTGAHQGYGGCARYGSIRRSYLARMSCSASCTRKRRPKLPGPLSASSVCGLASSPWSSSWPGPSHARAASGYLAR